MKPIFLKKGTGRGRVLALKSEDDFERLVKVWASEKYTMALLADVDGEWFVEVDRAYNSIVQNRVSSATRQFLSLKTPQQLAMGAGELTL